MPSQTFAEYENSAPELVTQVPISQSKPTGSSNLKGGLEPYSGYANPSVGKVHKRRVLGVAPWMAFAFISIALVIVVGVVVGAVLGTKHKSHTSKLSHDATEHFLEFANLYLSHCACDAFSNTFVYPFSSPFLHRIHNSYCHTNGSHHH